MKRTTKISKKELAGLIDHTFLKSDGKPEIIKKLCTDAIQYGFACIMVHPSEIENAVRYLAGSQIKVGSVVGFPLGHNTKEVKIFETKDAIERGANEIDMVINISALIGKSTNYVQSEIESIVNICRRNNIISKVIIETCYLSRSQIELVCRIVMKVGADFVKTSTGFGPEGATVENVKIMKSVVGDSIGIKAAGGIRTFDTVIQMIEAGATRIGTSAGVDIINEMTE
ncbi:MAG: deoxyribose-phosphate aldolase [Bacteroidales bacterium]|nr:deoxyribose-phosphate aldolase [Bacteroidales bacterium]